MQRAVDQAVELWASAACPSDCVSSRRDVHQARQIHSFKGFLVDLEERLRYGEKRNFCIP